MLKYALMGASPHGYGKGFPDCLFDEPGADRRRWLGAQFTVYSADAAADAHAGAASGNDVQEGAGGSPTGDAGQTDPLGIFLADGRLLFRWASGQSASEQG